MTDYSLQGTRPGAPALSHWGAFGRNDEIGTVNFLTSKAVLRGVQAVKSGERFPLNLPLSVPQHKDSDNYLKHAFKRNSQYTTPESDAALVVNDDYISFATQGSTQWDSLIHVGMHEAGVDGVFYNGVPQEAVDNDGYAHANGIDKVAEVGVAGRGVLLDIARMVSGGTDPLPLDYTVTPEDTSRCMSYQNVTLQSGDIVCFRTGWLEVYLAAENEKRRELLSQDQPGISGSHAQLAYTQQWGAVVSDNVGVEPMPMRDIRGSAHILMLRNLGLLFGELFDLRALSDSCASDRRWEFLFVASPLWIPGGMGSPACAMAIR